MAFWGTEVRAGTPYTHCYDEARGRLRVSQATLGSGKGMAKSVLQCNVGEKSPVLLCNLIPDKAETCHLELEFEEFEDVVFSVLGPKSIHLSGYYIGSGNSGNGGGYESDEPYGEDIAESETDDSGSYDDSEDDYESDFIDDDDDMEMFPSSPRHKSGGNVVIEEIIEDDKAANGNTTRRRLKKKHEVTGPEDSDVGSERQLVVRRNNIVDSEDEDVDGFPISFSLNKKTAAKSAQGNERSDGKDQSDGRKRKIDAVSEDSGLSRNVHQPYSSEQSVDGAQNKSKSKKKKKERGNDRKALETSLLFSTEATIKGDPIKDLGEEVVAQNENQDDLAEAKTGNKEKDLTVEADGANVSRKLKKKTKEKTKKVVASEAGFDISEKRSDDSAKGDQNDNEILDSEIAREGHQNVENGVNHVEAEKMDNGSLVTQLSDKAPDAEANPTASITGSDAKKKKKKKNKSNGKSSKDESSDLLVAEEKDVAQPMKPREYPGGLTIEEVSMGQPDGKRASPGDKVSVHYIGKLKNGTIFDSNIGKKPFKFRLGIGQVIKGWDIGVNGMRLGDKRRLTIPPSLGYGNKGVGKIPANSWLIFDVELVNVQ